MDVAGHPVVLCSYAPSGSAAKAVLFGDLSRWVNRVDGEAFLYRLVERYAKKDQVAFNLCQRLGGALVDTSAVSFVSLAT
jgi:HK97 family phage major capsid protein